MLVIVRSVHDLLLLPRQRHVNGFGYRSRVRLQISGLPQHLLIRAERALNRLQSRCGCVAGALTMSAVVIGGIVRWHSQSLPVWTLAGFTHGLTLLFLAFTAGLIAKLATLFVTKLEFSRLCKVQHEALSRLLATPGS